jgi:hypothetical protein
MPTGNAWKHRPERQARILADMRNPEYMRRREIYQKAKGIKKRRVAEWNRQWSVAGRAADFPDFDAWWLSPAADERRAWEAATAPRKE